MRRSVVLLGGRGEAGGCRSGGGRCQWSSLTPSQDATHQQGLSTPDTRSHRQSWDVITSRVSARQTPGSGKVVMEQARSGLEGSHRVLLPCGGVGLLRVVGRGPRHPRLWEKQTLKQHSGT